MTNALKARAAELLPRCQSLADAERFFGGEWDGSGRDRLAAAESWGLHDGYRGNPAAAGDVLSGCRKLYDDAYRVGRQIATGGK